jgi:hypothetical protein
MTEVWDLSMTVTDVPGVARLPADRFSIDAETVIVVGHRDHRVGADSTNFASPRPQRLHRSVDDELDGMKTVCRVGEIVDRQVAAKFLDCERS